MFRLLTFLTISIFVFYMYMLPVSYAEELYLVRGQAQADAKEDVGPYFKSVYFSSGAAMGCLGCIGGAFSGFHIGSATSSPSGSGLSGSGLWGPSDPQACGCIAGAVLLGVVVPHLILSLRISTPDPPPKRLLGKPPEYIVAYTQSYKSELRKLRRQHGTTGVIIGNLGSIGASLALLAVFLPR